MPTRINTTKSAIRNLQIIIVLDSISYGLIYLFIPLYILKLGGNQIHVGILAIGNFIGECLAPDVIKTFSHQSSKRYLLFFVLDTALVSHLLLGLTNSYWFTIIVRILFSLTNQTQKLCLDLWLKKISSEDERLIVISNYNFLSITGYIFGPIISGHLFDVGFGYITIFAASLTLINSSLLMKVKRDERDCAPDHEVKPLVEKIGEKIFTDIGNLSKSDWNKNWDVLLMKYCFASSMNVFFAKISLLIKTNYKASNVTFGYTTAYINFIVFAAHYYIALSTPLTESCTEIFLIELIFFLLATLILLTCYASLYPLFMLLLIPIILLRTILMDLWKELFKGRQNPYLSKLNESMSVWAGLTTPLIFGFVCNQMSEPAEAVVLCSFAPIIICWITMKYHTRNI